MRLHEITDEYLFEMPEMIGGEDFGLESDKINHEMAGSFIRDKSTIKVGDINGHQLYKCDNRYAVIEDDNGTPTIKYLVKYEINHISLIGKDAVQQVALWRDTDSQYNNIANKIFFDYILPQTGCIVTDLYQTEYGQRFWDSRVKDALKLGHEVYFIDSNVKSIDKIESYSMLRELKSHIWGNGDQYQHRRIIICT